MEPQGSRLGEGPAAPLQAGPQRALPQRGLGRHPEPSSRLLGGLPRHTEEAELELQAWRAQAPPPHLLVAWGPGTLQRPPSASQRADSAPEWGGAGPDLPRVHTCTQPGQVPPCSVCATSQSPQGPDPQDPLPGISRWARIAPEGHEGRSLRPAPCFTNRGPRNGLTSTRWALGAHSQWWCHRPEVSRGHRRGLCCPGCPTCPRVWPGREPGWTRVLGCTETRNRMEPG